MTTPQGGLSLNPTGAGIRLAGAVNITGVDNVSGHSDASVGKVNLPSLLSYLYSVGC